MLKTNLKLAIRHLRHSQTASLINVFGLALGLAAVFFIWQYIQMEYSYDKFHTKADRIYRTTLKFHRNFELAGHDAMNVAPVGPALKDEFPEVQEFVRFSPEYGRTVFKYGGLQFEEENLYYADSTLFEVFDFPLIEGDPNTCLNRPFTTLLTLSVAERYFGPRESWTESPIGKTLTVNNQGNLEITGILEDVPENSHLKFNVLISFSTFPLTHGDPNEQWRWNDFFTYLLLREAASATTLAAKMPDFNTRHLKWNDEGFFNEAELQPLSSIHLHSKLGFEAEPNGDAKTVYFLFLIGVAVIIVAWINYINLATARAEQRAKEVGLRKVIGADRKTLVSQFLTEALLVNLAAIMLAVTLVQIGQPVMDHLLGKALPTFLSQPLNLWLLPVLLLFGTILSGLYPAIFLAGFSTAKILKGGKHQRGKGLLRRGLVVFQYAVSVVLIIGTVVIFLQLNHMKNQNLGFSLDQQLIINAPSGLDNDSIAGVRYRSFSQELLNLPEIEKIGGSTAIPGKKYLDLDQHGGIRLMSADKEKNAAFKGFGADAGFIDVFGLEILAGRNFSEEMKTDDNAIIINETALRLFELEKPKEAIGKLVNYQGDQKQIVGVVSDYHHRSLRHAYEPMIFRNYRKYVGDFLYYSVQTRSNDQSDAGMVVGKVQQSWDNFFPDSPFNFFFLDDHFNEQYLADQRLGSIVAIFSSLAILIACLGLFGLASYMVSIRTKEIGIRKVLGASVTGLVHLLSKDFLALVLIAMVVASPLAWLLMNGWLENFAYRINIRWWVFGIAGAFALGIAFFTVSLQSVKAALANPVESLKNE